MMLRRMMLLLLMANAMLGNSQNNHSKIGIQLGNNLSIPNGSSGVNFKEDYLLRYSVGIVGRQILAEKLKFGFISQTRKAEISLDYGLNLVFKGYNYKLENLEAQREEMAIEIPIQICLQDKRNVFIPRKLLRKGITTFFRLGFKGIYNPDWQRTKVKAQQNERLEETLNEKKFNVMGTMGGGIIRNHKNGRVTMFEIAINIGLFKAKNGKILYRNLDTQLIREASFQDNGNYLSMNMTYLFNRPKLDILTKVKNEPIIFSPRF